MHITRAEQSQLFKLTEFCHEIVGVVNFKNNEFARGEVLGCAEIDKRELALLCATVTVGCTVWNQQNGISVYVNFFVAVEVRHFTRQSEAQSVRFTFNLILSFEKRINDVTHAVHFGYDYTLNIIHFAFPHTNFICTQYISFNKKCQRLN